MSISPGWQPLSDNMCVSVSDEQEVVQKRTFTKWINSHLAKVRLPVYWLCPVHVLLMDSLDGTSKYAKGCTEVCTPILFLVLFMLFILYMEFPLLRRSEHDVENTHSIVIIEMSSKAAT